VVRSSTYFFLFLFLIACSNSSNQSIVNGEAFGTTWQIKFYKNTTDFKDQELELKINNELERIDSIFSLYDKNSTISQINQDQSLQWNRSIGYEDFSKLIKISDEVTNKSGGYYQVFINGKWDFNSIAKGYAVDRLSQILESYGLTNYMVEIGGEIKFSGKKPQLNWTFAIIDPTFEERLFEEFQVNKNFSIATSGNYRNPGHIIDPSSKISVESNLLSVSVIDEVSTARADAWATALFASKENWLSIADNYNLAAFFIYKDNKVIKSISTDRWQEMLR